MAFLTDNRSPSFGPEIEADDVQSMSVYTAGIPAEYGRKMGGVVEMVTSKDSRHGLHGEAAFAGGSFATADGYLLTQYGWGKNALGASAEGAMTDRYLNPPVLQNYTNNGTTGDFGISFDRDFTNHDRLHFSVRHELSRFLVPNEQVQQAAGQRQDRNNFETMGVASYQHLFSPNVVGDFRGMVRDARKDSPRTRFRRLPLSSSKTAFARATSKGRFQSITVIRSGKLASSRTLPFFASSSAM